MLTDWNLLTAENCICIMLRYASVVAKWLVAAMHIKVLKAP
jgi:hypothetical protein